MSDKRALLLAAGRGSRMGALTAEQPKGMTEFLGKPLVDHQVTSLRAAGIDQIAIVTGYKGELLRFDGIENFENARWADTNMVSSLICANAWLQDAACIVSYSDIFYSPDTVTRLMDCDADIAISFDPDWQQIWQARFEDPLSDAESFVLDETGQYVVEIGARAEDINHIEGQYMGLLRFSPAGWAQVRAYVDGLDAAQVDKLDMTSLLSALIGRGCKLGAVPQTGGWGEIDSHSDLMAYEKMHAESPFQWITNERAL